MQGRPLHDRADVEKSADQFRERYAPNHIGELDIEAIVEFSLELRVIPVPKLCRKLSVKGWAGSDKLQIVVDRNFVLDQHQEYRQVLAHETAHIWRHRRLFPTLPFRSRVECRSFHAGSTETETAVTEHEANLWAGHVLVPRKELEMVFSRTVREIQKLYDVLMADGPWADDERLKRQIASDEVVRAVAKHFNVTPSWAERRIRDDGLWRRVVGELAAARESVVRGGGPASA